MIGRIGAWFGWVVAALLLAPAFLDAGKYEGYRPEGPDLWLAGTLAAVVAGLGLGWANRRQRLPLVLVAMAVTAAVHAGAAILVYHYVIPLDEGLPGVLSLALMVVLPVIAAALGFGAGSLVRRPPGAFSTTQSYATAIAIAVVGASALTGFVRLGVEWATIRFEPAGASAETSLDLAAGRHAVYATYNDQPATCVITGSTGTALRVRQPSIEFTDHSDGIVTVLFGVFDLPAADRVAVDCPRTRIGAPPEVRGPLGDLIFWPIALLWLIGAAPGLLVAGYTTAHRRGLPESSKEIIPA